MKRLLKDEIEAAKQADLLTYMQRYEPEELIRVGPMISRPKRTAAFVLVIMFFGTR